MRKNGGKSCEGSKFATVADTLAFVRKSAETESLEHLLDLVTEFSAAVSNADFIGIVNLYKEFEIVSKFGSLSPDGAPAFDCSLTSNIELIKSLSKSALNDASGFADSNSSAALPSLLESCGICTAYAFDLSLDNGYSAALILIGIDSEFDADETKPLFFEIANVFRAHATRLATAGKSIENQTDSKINVAGQTITLGDAFDRPKNTEAKLASIFSTLPYIVLYETGGGREYISQNIYEWLGYSADDLIKDRKNFVDLIHPDDRPILKGKVSEWHAAGEPDMLTLWFRVKRADGEYRWVEDRMVSIKPYGAPKYMTGVMLDVTDVKNANIQRERSKRYLDGIIDSITSMIVVRDEHGVIQVCNKEIADVYGLLPEDMVGMSHYNLWESRNISSGIIERWVSEDVQVIKDGVRFDYIEDISRDDNHYVCWRTIKTPLTLTDGTRCVVVNNENVTDKFLVEIALRDSEVRFRSIFEESSIAMLLVGLDLYFLQANDAACKLLGYSRDELLKLNIESITHPDDIEASILNTALLHQRKSGSFQMKKRYIRKDGTVIWGDLHASIANKPDGEPWITIAQIIDVTAEIVARDEQKVLIEELTKAIGEIKTLRGMIPICAKCKNIRDDSGYWQQIETYFKKRSGAEFSHSICPKCAKQLYPEYYGDDIENESG